MEEIWRTIRRRDLMRYQPHRLALAVAGRHPSFLDNRHGAQFLRHHLGGRLVGPGGSAKLAAGEGFHGQGDLERCDACRE